MTKPLQKALIVLGFGTSDGAGGWLTPPRTSNSDAVRRAVQEALRADLKELIFVTSDSTAPVEARFGDVGSAKAERVVIARQFAARCLGEALCGVRHLLDEQPFALLVPNAFDACADEDVMARLVAAYRENGGNIVAVSDGALLQREGSFAAIRAASAGRYLLQPAVLDALEDNPEAGLAAALLATAEAWPVTALGAGVHAARLHPLVPSSEAPTVRGPRPVGAAAPPRRTGSDERAGGAGL